MLKMEPEALLTKLIIRCLVYDNKKDIIDLLNRYPINWDRFKDLILYHEVTPFAYLVFEKIDASIPDNFNLFLKNNYHRNLINSQQLWNEFLRITTSFDQEGITLLPIKGIALLPDLYEGKPVRPMRDIDLLFKERDIQAVLRLFDEMGYKEESYGLKNEYWRQNHYHVMFYKTKGHDKIFVEAHYGLDYKREGAHILSELWPRIREVKLFNNNLIKFLSPEDTFFSLTLHNRRFGRALCFKSIYDIILLLVKYKDIFDWDYVLAQSKKYRLNTTAFFALAQAGLVYDLDIPVFVQKELHIPGCKRALINNFIQKNAFSPRLKKKQKKLLYLKSHFLLYDSMLEPIRYIINIPKEQFAQYYGLEPYDSKTEYFYKNRLIYIIFWGVGDFIKTLVGGSSLCKKQDNGISGGSVRQLKREESSRLNPRSQNEEKL